ncbi:MAG: hypothetical protein NZ455_04430 [Bacteroidia bacterium]|nr:hypothetical protein [Bacteroidia bacterium]MDW8347469.1 hypothetical protein [Bacteroidia bacterium]
MKYTYIILLVLFCSTICGITQNTGHVLIPVQQLPDAPQNFITFTYEEMPINKNSITSEKNIQNYSNLIYNQMHEKGSYTYFLIFSPIHAESTIKTYTEKLLEKWNFENNYPYSCLIILSEFEPRFVWGKYLTCQEKILPELTSNIATAWKEKETFSKKILKIVEQIKTYQQLDLIQIKSPIPMYASEWDKYYFWNSKKIVSEKQERYLNQLLNSYYQKTGIRIWVVFDAPDFLVTELTQKANFYTGQKKAILSIKPHCSQTDITIRPNIVHTTLTTDLYNQWNTFSTHNQIKQITEFYCKKGWYYDQIKETTLAFMDELQYKSSYARRQEIQTKENNLKQDKEMYEITIKMHKFIYWIAAILLLLPLLWSRNLINRLYAGENSKKINDMKNVLGLGYELILIVFGIWISLNTPLFFIESLRYKIFGSVLLWVGVYTAILIALHAAKLLTREDSIYLLFFCTVMTYCLAMFLGYTFHHDSWIYEHSDVAGDIINTILILVLGGYTINFYLRRKSRVSSQYNAQLATSRSSITRGGFGKRPYVSKYLR